MSQHRRSARGVGRGAQLGAPRRRARFAPATPRILQRRRPTRLGECPRYGSEERGRAVEVVLPADRLDRAVRGRRRVAVVTRRRRRVRAVLRVRQRQVDGVAVPLRRGAGGRGGGGADCGCDAVRGAVRATSRACRRRRPARLRPGRSSGAAPSAASAAACWYRAETCSSTEAIGTPSAISFARNASLSAARGA